MKVAKILSIFMLLVGFRQSMAIEPVPSLHEIPGLDGANLELRFTNPQCGEHIYPEPVSTAAGDYVTKKPVGYCRGKQDYLNGFNWQHSPRTKLIEWIQDPTTTEIFFAFQTISDGAVLGAICEAIRDRSLRVTFVVSRHSGPTEDGGFNSVVDPTQTPVVENESSLGKLQRAMDKLTSCGLPESAPKPVGLLRGHSGTSKKAALGWAHNKMFLVNPKADSIKFAVGSGNLSGIGVSSNHENWLFFSNIPKQSYLAQSHLCLMNSQLDEAAQSSLRNYVRHNQKCLKAIPAEYKKAKGIYSYFVPGEGEKAIEKVLIPNFSRAKKITMVAHLFGYPALFVRGLTCAASKSPKSSCFKNQSKVPGFKKGIGGAEVRLMTDDDIHWMRVGQTGDDGKVGFNAPWEAKRVGQVERAGGQVRYIQTNHQDGFIQLQHNKIILFDGDRPAVWTGAGNFTASAMHTNFENYYLITIPSVVAAYRHQLDSMWDKMSTAPENMPSQDVVPLLPEPLID